MYQSLAANPNAVVWTMSLAGDITAISDSIQAVRGFTPEEARAQGGDEIHTTESLSYSLRYFEKFSKEMLAGQIPEPFHGELEYKCKDGSTVWCDVFVEPVTNPAGDVIEIAGVSTPISL